jgi:hypothetical protein
VEPFPVLDPAVTVAWCMCSVSTLAGVERQCAIDTAHVPAAGWINVVDGNLEADFCSIACFDEWFSDAIDPDDHLAEPGVEPRDHEVVITAPSYTHQLESLYEKIRASHEAMGGH